MRLLKNPNFDFMSKKLFALTISGLIGLAGIVSLIFHGGPKLSIDFKGGTFGTRLISCCHNDIKLYVSNR